MMAAICFGYLKWPSPGSVNQDYKKENYIYVFFDILLTVHLNIFILILINLMH